jgi:hypothetical protein
MAHSLASLDAPKLDKIFFDAARKQLRFLEKTKVNVAELPERGTHVLQMFPYGKDSKTLVLEEYSDWYELQIGDNMEEVAQKLGFAAGSVFNALVNNAMRKHGWGVTVVDPLVKNLKFTCVVNDGPTINDPTGMIPGWLAFRFYFAAGA